MIILKITSVNLKIIEKENSRMRAIASIVLDDMFVIHDIRVIEGDKGLFVAMPSKKTPSGDYRDIAHPINAEGRKMFEETILSEYNKQVD